MRLGADTIKLTRTREASEIYGEAMIYERNATAMRSKLSGASG